jgi:Zinc-binding dehydrogenase
MATIAPHTVQLHRVPPPCYPPHLSQRAFASEGRASVVVRPLHTAVPTREATRLCRPLAAAAAAARAGRHRHRPTVSTVRVFMIMPLISLTHQGERQPAQGPRRSAPSAWRRSQNGQQRAVCRRDVCPCPLGEAAAVRPRQRLGGVAIDLQSDEFRARVRELTDGVDVVLDGLGGSVSLRSFRALRPGGRLVLYGHYATLTRGRKSRRAWIEWYASSAAVALWRLLSPRRRVLAYRIQRLRDSRQWLPVAGRRPARLMGVRPPLPGVVPGGLLRAA